MLVLLLVLTGIGAVIGIGFMAAMVRRNQPHLGIFGLISIQAAGLPAAVYGALTGT